MATLGEILEALRCATDQNPAVLKPAEDWLRRNEADGSFYVSLSEICHNYDIDWTIRWMAVVYLKNGIDKYWRPRSSESLSPENKSKIRNNIQCCIEEPVHQIAIQCSVVISKIARFDYPSDWEQLIPFLLSGISTPRSTIHHNRSLLVFRHVIKMLSTKKLPHAKETFAELCRNIFGDMFQHWISSHEKLKQFAENIASNSGQKTDDRILENHIHLSHIIEYTIHDYGLELNGKIHEYVLQNLNDMITMSEKYNKFENLSNACLKIAVISVKILNAMLCVSAESYNTGVHRAMSLLCTQIHAHTASVIEDDLQQKLIVKCINVCKTILDSNYFFDAFLGSSDFALVAPSLETLFQCLVCHYLPLKESDLVSWEDDAEEFSNEEVGESWKFNLRPSAEVLALTLLKKFPDLLVQCLINMLKVVQDLDVHNISASLVEANNVLQVIFKGCKTPLECMVRKEAVYYMIGLGVYEVLEAINFEDWLMKKLLPEVKLVQNEPHGKLIHRRVLWLISQWTEVKPSDELKPVLYGFTVTSLGKSFDMAVRLTASSTIQYLLDDFEFDVTQFQSYQDSCFQGLYDLLIDVKNCDTKMRILNVFTYLIERLGNLVEPYEKKISGIIPPLWDHAVSENHNMLKCAIMGTMVQFIYALKEKSNAVNHLTFPLVKESTDMHSPSHVYLLEDGLELWLAAVQNCSERNEIMFKLFNNIFELLEYGSETVKTCFNIIDSYVLLYGDALQSQYGTALDKSFVNLATDVRNECLVLISRIVSNMVEVAPEDGPLPCLEYCRDSFKRVFYEKDSVLLAANFTLSANMVFKNVSQFFQQVQELARESGEDFNATLERFLKIWCENIDSIVDIDKKKVVALSLLVLSSALPDVPAIGHVFPDIICAVVQVFYDVCDEHHADMLLHEPGSNDFDPNQDENLHDRRRRLLRNASAAMTISLPAFASQKFKFLQGRVSQQIFSELISSVNTETLNELKNFLSAY